MTNTWFIGDTHFYHKNIIDYANRPFKSVEDMNKSLIDTWNNRVNKIDRVLVLGDFWFGATRNCEEILNQLKGYKILIMGNHDTISPNSYLQSGFKEVYRYPILFENFYLLSHYPLYINSNMPYANLFAHVHGNPAYSDYTSQTMCVSIERPHMEYGPINFNTVKALMGHN